MPDDLINKVINAPHQFGANWWDPDSKYSQWRRDFPYKSRNIRKLYCTDIDWVEWRRGKPVAIIETTRCHGKAPMDCLNNYLTRNNGFQPEVAFKIAKALEVPAYLVLIADPAPSQQDDFRNAVFYVAELIDIALFKKKGVYHGPDDYLNFLRLL